MLELASVEGRSFSSRAVAELSGDETRGDLEALLAELVQKELVRPDGPAVATSSGTSSSATPPTSRSRSPYGLISTSGSRASPAGPGRARRASSPPTTAAGREAYRSTLGAI